MEPRLTGIDRKEALIYLGYKGGVLPEDVEGELARCERLVLEAARPRACYGETDVVIDGATVTLGPLRVESRDLARNLRGCDRAVCFAATLGAEADRLRRRSSVTSPARALVLDAMGSAGIETVCDGLCEHIRAVHPDRKLRPRFSPGYGDLSLEFQRPFLTLLDAQRKAGITLLDSLLMTPQKSVSAIVGLAHTGCDLGRSDCDGCGKKDCEFRL